MSDTFMMRIPEVQNVPPNHITSEFIINQTSIPGHLYIIDCY